MENADGATEVGSLELGLSTETGSSCQTTVRRFQSGQNVLVYVVPFGIDDAGRLNTFSSPGWTEFTLTVAWYTSSRILLAAFRVSLSQAAARMFSAMAEVR